jgi:hypothetical protein
MKNFKSTITVALVVMCFAFVTFAAQPAEVKSHNSKAGISAPAKSNKGVKQTKKTKKKAKPEKKTKASKKTKDAGSTKMKTKRQSVAEDPSAQ